MRWRDNRVEGADVVDGGMGKVVVYYIGWNVLYSTIGRTKVACCKDGWMDTRCLTTTGIVRSPFAMKISV